MLAKKNKLNNLRALIESQGCINIATFMEEVNSYYYEYQTSIGAKGDFITAPEISQLFGEMIGIWVAQAWQNAGAPTNIALVELGPGRGTLMNDLLRVTKHIPGFWDSIEVHLVEQSSKLIKQQQAALEHYFSHIKFFWHDSVKRLPQKPIILVANEFFDALPVNQYIKNKDLWHEIMVAIMPENGNFYFMEMPVHQKIQAYLSEENPNAKHRSVVEYSTASILVMQDICDLIKSNGIAACIIDYGYNQDKQIRTSFNSTLQAVKNHKYHPVLSDIGEADLTAHVDFNALKQVADNRDCQTYTISTQGEFLKSLGIEKRLNSLSKNASSEQIYSLYSGFERLTSDEQMGKLFKVLLVASTNVLPLSSPSSSS